MTGGVSWVKNEKGKIGQIVSDTTEILNNMEDRKWTVLKNGKLPGNYRFRTGLRLATVNNNVFAFGILK